jgi:phosphatidylserine/phosphatidylglycerophosphate/cardiolipin synthase-like enzyme
VVGLVWRSHLELFDFTAQRNIALAERVNGAGGQILLDQRVRPLGSHHQKFVVVRYAHEPAADVAFGCGIDIGHGRRDDARHRGDEQTRGFNPAYGPRPAWHDVQVRLRGPAVRSVELSFRERWEDPSALSRMPWHVLSDWLRRRLDRRARPLPPVRDAVPGQGRAVVQLLRTYPRRFPASPFARRGERSVARGYSKAMRRARRLVYLEDQYVWSQEAARVFCGALREHPDLRLVLVVPRLPDSTGLLAAGATVGHSRAVEMLREAGGDRVAVFDPENHEGRPVYVHAKVCVVDDVWATVGSDNINRRSWTHDSELTAAVLDEEPDQREPVDPGGLGDGARRFARELRLALMREHLDLSPGEDDVLLDPADAFEAVVASAQRLEDWYTGGKVGPRPPGRLRPHTLLPQRRRGRVLAALGYGLLLDPDGRPRSMRRRHEF